MIASAAFVDVNDADNDLLPDDWETFYALVNPPENPARLRYEDPDCDELDNLEEFLAGKNPTVSDNDVDADRLPDNWEYEFFRTLAFSAAQDLDRDGSTNGVEFSQGTHPGRPVLGLPLPTVDWGDAPAPYPTTLADGGAVHQAGGPTLGVNRDSEADGQPNATATGDDTAGAIDDEDGVTFGAVRVGQTGATLTVIVQNAPGGARLDAWIDFNADGRDDLVGRNQFGYWWVAASNGTGGFTNSIWGTWDPARTWTNVMVGDFHKYGCSDLVARNEFGYWWVAASNGSGAFVSSIWGKWDPARTWTNVMVGDFNADGADDLIGRNQFGYWWVAESNGSNALANAIWGQWSTARTWTDVMVGDFDGSGDDDVVGRNEFGYWGVAKSNGTDSLANEIWGQWDNSRNWTDVMVGDFNRDGDDDLVGRDKFDYWWVGESDGWDQFATAYWGKWNDVDWLDVLGGNFGD